MPETQPFKPFELDIQHDELTGRRDVCQHTKLLNYVYLFSFSNGSVSWKLKGPNACEKDTLNYNKKRYPTFGEAVKQINSKFSALNVVSKIDLERFIDANLTVAQRLVKSLAEFQFNEIASNSQYLSAINQFSSQWFSFVQKKPEFVKFYEDRLALADAGLPSTVDQLSVSQEA